MVDLQVRHVLRRDAQPFRVYGRDRAPGVHAHGIDPSAHGDDVYDPLSRAITVMIWIQIDR